MKAICFVTQVERIIRSLFHPQPITLKILTAFFNACWIIMHWLTTKLDLLPLLLFLLISGTSARLDFITRGSVYRPYTRTCRRVPMPDVILASYPENYAFGLEDVFLSMALCLTTGGPICEFLQTIVQNTPILTYFGIPAFGRVQLLSSALEVNDSCNE